MCNLRNFPLLLTAVNPQVSTRCRKTSVAVARVVSLSGASELDQMNDSSLCSLPYFIQSIYAVCV